MQHLCSQDWCCNNDAECLAVQLPGRGTRAKEPFLPSTQEAAKQLLPVVASRLQDTPYLVQLCLHAAAVPPAAAAAVVRRTVAKYAFPSSCLMQLQSQSLSATLAAAAEVCIHAAQQRTFLREAILQEACVVQQTRCCMQQVCMALCLNLDCHVIKVYVLWPRLTVTIAESPTAVCQVLDNWPEGAVCCPVCRL